MDASGGDRDSRLNLNPLSSLDLVDAFLDVDDTVNTYLKSLQPVSDNPDYMLQDVNAMPSWSGMVRGYPSGSQPQPQHQDLPYPFNTSEPQAGVQLPPGDAQVVTTGGDPGFVFQAGAGKSSAESGSTTGHRGRKRTSSNTDDGIVQKKQQVTQEKNRLAQRRFRERQKAKVSGLHTEIDDLRAQVGALQMQNSALHSQNSILEKVLSMRDEQITAMQEDNSILGVGSDDEAEKDRAEGFTLSGLKGREVKLSRADLKKMTADQVMQIWQAYVTEISEALVEVGTGGTGAMERIELLINEICMLCLSFNAVNPVSAGKMHVRDAKETEAEELKQWKSIVATLELTDEQKLEIIQLRKMLLQKLQRLLAERGKLNLTIQPALPSSTVGHRIAVEYLKANQTLVRLKEILRAEHRAMLDFVTAFVKEVMKPLQIAKVLVQSYPVKPDLLAIASSIAMERGEDLGVPDGGMFPVLESGPSSGCCDAPPACFIGGSSCGSELAGHNVLSRLGLNPEH
ncbi:hypothetical protein BSKO_04950 [Bryopsis sp. KO-2023]|nr:hypothetical protein BSKO_04950 [Bryopsis sp. KO-2023]